MKSKLPVIMVKVACLAVCAHAIISSSLYCWINKNLIGDLQVETGNNSNMYHSQYLQVAAGIFYCPRFFLSCQKLLVLCVSCEVFVVSLYLPLTAIGQPHSTRNYACFHKMPYYSRSGKSLFCRS